MTEAPLRPWPASTVTLTPIGTIHEYERNVLVHDDDQVRKLADSMLAFGVTAPLLVDEAGVLIYGHGRRKAAALLVSEGHSRFASLPVVTADGWTEDEKAAYRVADNALGRLAPYDFPALKAELAELSAADFDMGLLGFPDAQLQQLLAGGAGARDPESTPEAPRYYECKNCGAKNEL